MPIRDPRFLSAINTDDLYPQDREGVCEQCLKVGVRSTLSSKIWKYDKDGKPSIDSGLDPEKFRQCHRCGSVFPITDIKKEGRLEDFADTVDNPFDAVKSQEMQTLRQSSSSFIADKHNLIKHKYKQKRKQIDSIADPEVKQLLEQGAEVVDYRET